MRAKQSAWRGRDWFGLAFWAACLALALVFVGGCQNDHVRRYGTAPTTRVESGASRDVGTVNAVSGADDPVRPVNAGLRDAMRSGDAFDEPAGSGRMGWAAEESVDPSRDPEAWFDGVELDMQRLLDERSADAAFGSLDGGTLEANTAEAGGEIDPPDDDVDAPGVVASNTAQIPAADRARTLASELAAVLRRAAAEGDNPVWAYAAIAGLGVIDPGVMGDEGAWRSELEAALLGSEPAYIEALGELVLSWNAMVEDGIDPRAASEALESARVKIAQGDAGLSIVDAVLCSRVSGFGKYVPFRSATFLAGRAQQVIVYTELEGFGYRAAREGDPLKREGDKWAVEVSQELTLFHEPSGDLQAWRRGKRTIVDTSRRKRRDFYLVDQIELPRTLTVGSYLLKIRVHDEVRGTVAERTIPIDVVADASLIGNR